MFKYTVLVAALTVLAVSDVSASETAKERAEPGIERLLATTSTSTRFVLTTVTATSVKSFTCFSTVNVTGACRRRRLASEKPIILSLEDEDVDIDSILPSAPLGLESTPVVELPSRNEEDLKEAIVATPLVEGSTADGVSNVEISGLDEICGTQPRAFFGFNVTRNYGLFAINFVVITTMTATTTTTVTTTSGTKTFVVSSCTPTNFPYSAC